jgi:hypothetical protein
VALPVLTVSSAQVQIVGQWNPSIFVPRWFSDVGLLPKEEAENAQIAIIHEEVAQFGLPWVTVQVTRQRFIITTTQESYAEPLRDLALGTLELLAHTPTKMMGINHDFILSYSSRAAFDALGWTLATPDCWPHLSNPGVATMQMQGERKDGRPGYVRVKVEPILDGTFTVALGVNDHYELSEDDRSTSTEGARAILSDRWQGAGHEAREIVEHLRTVGNK